MDDQVSPDAPQPTRTADEGETVDVPERQGFFFTGQVLGERYEVLEMLGRGGMGEVWRAFDLKLRVEVALKALREDLRQSDRRLERLRQEVRTARDVISPNVCRIFDLIEIEDRELVSMEYVDGATLLGVLQERGPLELKEAQNIASQFLAGLEAIHKAGLIHRDVKPENIMLTRAGRVVVMDFGIARHEIDGGGSCSGTPAYMAPEHAAGQEVDARADVYSAGVVLAEMVSPDGVKSFESRKSLWEGVRSEPAQVPDSPWAPVIERAVARDRERRPNSAHTLIRELEDVTLRVEGAEDLHPYPGLASFTEDDAEYFFGREAEVERLWRRIEGPPRLLGIMGPSGAGKTSFIRAGLTPNAQSGWSIIRCTPGNAAIASLRSALTPELSHRQELLQRLMADPDNETVIVDAIAGWREGHTGAVLIVDQFEELFTLNSRIDQQRFAALLGRLPLEVDVHVVASMRDDFAAATNAHQALQPIFSDLTVLNPPAGGNLRRALVQPATKCGYRFEDAELVEEILAEVEGERGALPLVAFALALLWDKRDRETGLLTRQAYHDIGGVGGALARHAEATVDRIGVERIPIVRELFRNLVTAEGTRAVREWDELLSVFGQACHPERNGLRGRGVEGSPEGAEIAPLPGDTQKRRTRSEPVGDSSTRSSNSLAQNDKEKRPADVLAGAGFTPARAAASEVLSELIDARLLTSYEVREDEHDPIRRVEIIHESLLANWPRLVRWQTQDADAAQIREQLRGAAKTWDENQRTDDLLWTGTAYRQFSVWREGYPGGLTETEEVFASAMTSFAKRRSRRRRLMVATLIAVLLTGLAVVGTFWRRSVSEAQRAEANELVALGQLELDSYPSATVAHAIASLERSDNQAARQLAVEALWKGPTVIEASKGNGFVLGFNPDGRSLVGSMNNDQRAPLSLTKADGSKVHFKKVHEHPIAISVLTSSTSPHFISGGRNTDSSYSLVLWTMDDHQPLADTRLEPHQDLWQVVVDGEGQRVVILSRENGRIRVDTLGFDGARRHIGTLDFETRLDESGHWTTSAFLDQRAGRCLGIVSQSHAYVVEVGDRELSQPRLIGIHDDINTEGGCDPLGRFLVTTENSGEFRFWSLTDPRPPIVVEGPLASPYQRFERDGSHFSAVGVEDGNWIVWLWEFVRGRPSLLRKVNIGGSAWGEYKVHPLGRYVARSGPDTNFRIWPLNRPVDAEPIVLFRGDGQQANDLKFNPNGDWLATADLTGFGMWFLEKEYPIIIRRHDATVRGLAFAPDGSWLASSSVDGTVRTWPLVGDPPAPGLVFRESESARFGVAVSPDGQKIVSGSNGKPKLFNLDGTPPITLEGFSSQTWGVSFSHDGRFAAAIGGFDPAERQIRVWDAKSGDEVTVLEIGEMPHPRCLQFISDGHLLSVTESGLWRWNVERRERTLVHEGGIYVFSASDDGDRVLMVINRRAILLDVDSGSAVHLDKFGDHLSAIALDPSGSFAVTATRFGEIRVGSVDGEDIPHLLLGHEGRIHALAIDPTGRWIASGGEDTTVRLWPMPDLSKPPLHTLPHDQLIAKLKTLTNLRVVRDPESSTGWTLTHDPFPGWETVPTW